MASSFNIPDPLILTGDISKNYKKFIGNFNRHLNSMGELNEEAKIKFFLLAIGHEGRKAYEGFRFTNQISSLTLKNITDKFEKYCESYGDNEVYYWYKFNSRNQLHNETFDDYLKEIFSMAEFFNLKPDEKERLIRNKLVSGINDENARKEIFIKGFKNLDDVIKYCREKESEIFPPKKVFSVIEIENDWEEIEVKPDIGHMNNREGYPMEIPSQSTKDEMHFNLAVRDDGTVLEKGEVSTSYSYHAEESKPDVSAAAFVASLTVSAVATTSKTCGTTETEIPRKKIVTQLEKRFPCKKCKSRFSHQRSLRTHIQKKHGNNLLLNQNIQNYIKCEICYVKFEGKSAYRNHMLVDHAIIPTK